MTIEQANKIIELNINNSSVKKDLLRCKTDEDKIKLAKAIAEKAMILANQF